MVGHDMSFLDPSLLLIGQAMKRVPEMLFDYTVELAPSIFWDEHDVVFALPSAMFQVLVVFHVSFALWL
jgi:hypothetical protein